MNYHFDSEIAKKYGVDEAIMIENLNFWITKNRANEKHFYEGRYWTYNSTKAFKELFPFWSERQIDRIIKNLQEKKAVHIGNFNQSTYDRTRWYALDESVYSISPFGKMETTKQGNGFTEKVEPIPDKKPDLTKTQLVNTYTKNPNLITTLNDYIDMRKNIKSTMTPRAIELMLNKLDELAKDDDTKILILNQSIMNSWKGIFPLKTEQQSKPQKQPTNQGSKREYDVNELEKQLLGRR